MSKHWYVVHAYRLRQQVKRPEDRIRRSTWSQVRRGAGADRGSGRDARRREGRSERKFFPGYVLVQIETDTEGKARASTTSAWHLVKDTPKVHGLHRRHGRRPQPIKEQRGRHHPQPRVREGVEKPRPKVLFEPGEMVWVIDGPFNDFNGWSRKSTTRRAACAWRYSSLGAPPRSSWSSARSRKPKGGSGQWAVESGKAVLSYYLLPTSHFQFQLRRSPAVPGERADA